MDQSGFCFCLSLVFFDLLLHLGKGLNLFISKEHLNTRKLAFLVLLGGGSWELGLGSWSLKLRFRASGD